MWEGRTVLFSGAHGQQDKAVFLPDQHKIEGDRSLMLSQIDPCDDLHYHLPVRFSLIQDVFIERGSSIKVDSSTLIEKQVDGLATNLVRLYFRFVHPVYPILQKKRFLQLFRTNREKLSPALRGCIYGIGARWLSFAM